MHLRYVPSQFLGDMETTQRFRRGLASFGPTRWHECVASVIDSCIDETKCTKQDLLEAAASMPYLIDVRGSLGDVADSRVKNQCGQAIISDGNDLFIDAYIKKNGMSRYFTHGIETNLGVWESMNAAGAGSDDGSTSDDDDHMQQQDKESGEKFRVLYQSAKYGGHSCKRCPPNLCKSQVLLDILQRTEQTTANRPRIVYVGDGSNDACPALNVLNENDVLLARGGRRRRDPNSKSGPESDGEAYEGHGEHTFHPEMHSRELEAHVAGAFPILSTLRKAKVNYGIVPKCRVSVWRSGKELRSLIRGVLDA
jgi:hypothetical protein